MQDPSSNLSSYNIPRIFQFTEKKLNFVVRSHDSFAAMSATHRNQKVTDEGDFVDNTYREIDTNTLMGLVVGRTNQSTGDSHTKTFYATDIAKEGYLYKRGSWFKTWKKRYFILRKDERALCYFESRENLKLLGYLPLVNSQVRTLAPEDAGNTLKSYNI